MKAHRTARGARGTLRGNKGFALMEVLASILVFSVGVLGIVGMHAVAAKDSVEAKVRSDASLLVDDLIGRMWASDRSASNLGANFQTGGTEFKAWLASAEAALPGIDETGTTVVVTPTSGGPGMNPTSQVVVRLVWKAQGDPQGQRSHQITSVTQISG